jgi:HprK-related kinase A
LIVADLSPPDLERRLRGDGLRVRTGPVVTNIRSALASVRRGIAEHYARHPVEADDGFADFHVSLELRPRPNRRHAHDLAFCFDGTEPIAVVEGDDGFPLLEWGLNWCVTTHCHHFVIIRGAALERDGHALLLPGAAGVGKSTLATSLTFVGGWRLLSDTLILLDPVTGGVLPLPRPIELKNDAIDAARAVAPSAAFGTTDHATPRGRFTYVQPSADSVANEEAARPAWVVAARYEAGSVAQLRPMRRVMAFMGLVEHALNFNVHGRPGFNALADMIERAHCHQCAYSGLLEVVAMLGALASERADAS